MAKKKRKSNSSARAAQKRNMEKTAYEKKHSKRIDFWKKNGKRIIIATITTLVLLVAVILCCKWFVSFDGHINIMFGNLRGVEENWIVKNLADSGQAYFKLGIFDVPEGYHIDSENSLTNDKLARAFYMRPDDETDKIESVYVSGIANSDASTMVAKLLSYGIYQDGAEAKIITIDGKEFAYIYAIVETTVQEEEGVEVTEEDRTGFSSLLAYVNTSHDSCILVAVTSPEASYAAVPSEEELMSVFETAAANLQPDALASLRGNYDVLREQLISSGIIKDCVFTTDYAFESPSAAAAVVLGRAANGL